MIYSRTRLLSAIPFVAFFALCLAALALQLPAHAVTPSAPREQITISPASSSYRIDAGTSVTDTMKVINNGDVGYEFILYARPYSVSNEAYEPNFTGTPANADAYKWIQFEKTNYRIEPGQTIEIGYTMRVPAGAAPGGHYGVVFAETKERELSTTGIARQKRVGKLLYATVNGEYRTEGELVNFELPFWQHGDSFTSNVRAKNTGNVDFEASVSTVARDMFGNAKFTYSGKLRILPETTRRIAMQWDKAPAFGLFKVEQNISFLDQRHANSGYVLIAPRWLPVLLLLMLVVGIGYAFIKKSRRLR